METGCSQHGPNCGSNWINTCGQHWGQDMTDNLYQQGLHPKTTLAQAQWVRMWWEALPPVPAWLEPNERPHAGKRAQPTANCMWQGQAVGSWWLKSHFKANWKQPLLMLWRFETIIGGLNPFQGEISCQVWVIAQSKAGVMWKWVINIRDGDERHIMECLTKP